MKNLEQCRQEIDAIDQELITLFEKRMQVCKEVVLYKLENNQEIFQPEREKSVIDKNVNRVKEESLKSYASNFVQDMMNISKSYQSSFVPLKNQYPLQDTRKENIIVGYQGVPGAFSYQSMKRYFGEVPSKDYTQFEDVFKALKNKEIDYGIVPLENSSTGAITDNYDLVRDYGFYIVGEQSISISQHLLGLPDSKIDKIEEVYSHPQGLQQSSIFLNQYPDIEQKEYTNTAASAKYIRDTNDITKAAIASKEAAELYGLKVLEENIENQKSNHTRFIIIGRNLEKSEGANRVSVVFTLQHLAGTLYSILKSIKDYDISLSRIESRPIANKPWEYYFYIDFEGSLEDAKVQRAIEEMKTRCLTLRILGNYQQK
ncbi:MAG: prephenate dehydratase [Coprobacillaceae bacterium]